MEDKIIIELPKTNGDKPETIKLNAKEIQREIGKAVSERTINEVLVVKDDRAGRQIELQSSSANISELNNLAWLMWQNFFMQGITTPEYIG